MMMGRLLKTLSHYVKQEEAEWYANNTIMRDIAYGRLRSILMMFAEHPLGCSLTALFLTTTGSVLIYFVPYCWFPIIPQSIQLTDLLTYFSALWSVQGSIAALLYPIVIAFVTLLLQRSHSGKGILHIYLHDTAAVFSGMSALSLLILMAIQYLFLTLVSVVVGIAWLLMDGSWFLINLGLTTYFLLRTFEYVRPSRRTEIVRRHTLNVTWPRELSVHLKGFLFSTAVENNLLPGTSVLADTNPKQPRLWLGRTAYGIGKAAVEVVLPRNSRLVDVRLRLLAWATSCWMKRAEASTRNMPLENGSSETEKSPTLLYPLHPEFVYGKGTVLCRIEGNVELSSIEKLLIRFSFRFQRNSPRLELSVMDVLNDIKAEALTALQNGELNAFSGAFDDLSELYGLIIEASAYKDNDLKTDNYARIPEHRDLFGTPIFKEWSQVIVDLFEAASNKISTDDAYCNKAVHIPHKLFAKLYDVATSDILQHFVFLQLILFYKLASWWVKTIEQQGIVDHNANIAAQLRPPFFGTYDSLLREFVGEWEQMKNYYFLPKMEGTVDWQDLQRVSVFYERHLCDTAEMIMKSVHQGDQSGATWLFDVLMKWFDQIQLHLGDEHYYFIKTELISFQIMTNTWEENQQVIDAQETRFIPKGNANKALFTVALKNYWIDVCCIISYMLATRGTLGPCERSLPAILLRSIVRGTTPYAGGESVLFKQPISTANDLFFSILRQYHAEGAYRRGYRARLDQLVDRLTQITKVPMVPGRIYSGWGLNDLDSYRDGQLFMLLLFMVKNWDPASKVERISRKWIEDEADEKLRELQDSLNQWKERFKTPEFNEYQSLYEFIRVDVSELSFKEASECAVKGIESIMSKIEAIRSKTLDNMPISATRLAEVSGWASNRGFSKEHGEFPLPLFSEIVSSAEDLKIRSVVLKNVSKGEYTDPPMAQRPINEQSYFEELVANHAAGYVMMDTIEQLSPEEVDGSSPEAYWGQMKNYEYRATQVKRNPILLLENAVVPDWIFEWSHPYQGEKITMQLPPEFKVWKDPNQKLDAYICHINSIAVYRAPLLPGASVLLTLESLKKVVFTKLPGKDFVQAEVEPVESKPALINLKLSWRYKVETDTFSALKLKYGHKEKIRQ